MNCLRGVSKICRRDDDELTGGEYDGGLHESPLQEACGTQIIPTERTWDVPAPSPSYSLVDEMERQVKLKTTNSRVIPPDLQEDMLKFKKMLEEQQEEKKRAAARAHLPKAGPEELKREEDRKLIFTEAGSGHRMPERGSTVRFGYTAVLEDDESIVDMCADCQRVLGEGKRAVGQVRAEALDEALVQMRRNAVVSRRCRLRDIFDPNAPAVLEHGPHGRVVLEIKLFEIFHTKDCSWVKSAGVVVKEALKDGVGAWCDNPTDEGFACLRIEEARDMQGEALFSGEPLVVEIVPGNGAVCDALECAILEMRRHETALVRCSDPALCSGGMPLGTGVQIPARGANFRVTLLDYEKGPDVWSMHETDRFVFARRRKLVAEKLVTEGRFHLARQRCQRVLELFHHMDNPKTKDRFLGVPEFWHECKTFRRECRLLEASCSLAVSEPRAAKQLCDMVVKEFPEDCEALFRRAEAFMQQQDFVQACRDLTSMLDLGGGSFKLAARELLDKAKKLRRAADCAQKHTGFKFERMIRKINDPRTVKNDYIDCPMEMPGVAPVPISARLGSRVVCPHS